MTAGDAAADTNALEVDLRHRAGAFSLDVAFRARGPLTALFGPSGSGKTTVVNLIAGLLRPDEGRIAVGGRVLVDTARGVFVPAHRRRIGYVFQDARLFPHLSVRANLAYGRWFAPRAERSADLAAIVELLGIGRLLDRRPQGLSGGERQRVAIGRALLASPAVLLMDEPLASLDEARKAEILPYIERLRDGMRVPIVHVSHSVAEVARLATDVVVLKEGRVTAAGPAATVFRHADALDGAERDEAGTVIDASVAAHDERFGMSVLRCRAGEVCVPRIDAAPGDPVRLRIRSRDVMIATERPRGISALNIFPGVVADIGAGQGTAVDVMLDCGGDPVAARITRQSLAGLGLTRGMPVFAIVKSVALDGGGEFAPAPIRA
ncbi:MAG: molybdenum ABC transporter ATP-binding protein [Rhizobiaceae bacterium]|nr:molybdenum ABC transporter ATP-binding protein [Rhizobiaceae bacterium]